MITKLYHELVYLPSKVLDECMRIKANFNNFDYSNHFKRQMEDTEDYKHYISDKVMLEFALAKLTTSSFKPFEVETEVDNKGNEQVCKIVIRVTFDNERDITFAIIPKENNIGFIKTAWLNNREDIHFTLDKSRYVQN